MSEPRVIDLTRPLLYETALPVDVLLVIELNRFLPDEMLVVTRDIQDRFDHFRHDVFIIDGQDVYFAILINGHA